MHLLFQRLNICYVNLNNKDVPMNNVEMKKDFLIMIYEKHKRRMFSIAYSILKDNQKSEDIIQDCIIAFDKFYERIRDMNDKKLSYYVYRTVKNKSLNLLKKSNRVSLVNFQIQESQFVDIHYDVSLNIINEEFITEIKEYLKQISDMQAEAFIYKYYYDFTNEEISDILNLSDNNVRALVYRTKKNIKDFVEEQRKYEFKEIR